MGYSNSLGAPYHSLVYGKGTYFVKIHTLPIHWIGMAIDPHQSHTAKYQIDMETSIPRFPLPKHMTKNIIGNMAGTWRDMCRTRDGRS